MNVRIEDGDSDDANRAVYYTHRRAPSSPQPVVLRPVAPESDDSGNEKPTYIERRRSGKGRLSAEVEHGRSRADANHYGDDYYVEEIHGYPEYKKAHRRRLKPSRVHARIEEIRPTSQPQSSGDQDPEDVLNDYLGGTPRPYASGADDGADYKLSGVYPMRYRPGGTIRPTVGGHNPFEASYHPEPPYPEGRLAQEPKHCVVQTLNDSTRVRLPDDSIIRRAPPSARGLWPRAAVPVKYNDGRFTLKLRLLLSRKGERYQSESFPYTTGHWDDISFAQVLKREYGSLKTAQIGTMQKLTSYKRIAFVYFVQYHAFSDEAFARSGRWEVTDKIPITTQDSENARSSFMFLFQKYWRNRVQLESKSRKPTAWVTQLNQAIDEGAVVDLEIKETFDTQKIYVALLLAILLSLGVALAYGFAMNNDFSTGFSIASWLLTSFGFFAAIVAAGEWVGLDKPTATLTAGLDMPERSILPPEMVRGTLRPII